MAGIRQPPSYRRAARPDIDWVARLGAAAQVADARREPVYLRSPDAQPQTRLAAAAPVRDWLFPIVLGGRPPVVADAWARDVAAIKLARCVVSAG